MKKHTLVCLLKDDKLSSYKTVRLSSKPSVEKLREVYFGNVETVKHIVKYCQQNNITSFRISSSLFPLSSHKDYRDMCLKVLDEVGKEYEKIDYSGVELSCHPDQFILLSSINPGVNENSRHELEVYAHMQQYIPWNLVNIHIGSKQSGFDEHAKIIKRELSLLSDKAKKLLSFENDEKNYSFEETLSIAQQNDIMMVGDFHHERCLQKRKDNNGEGLTHEEHIKWNNIIDENIYSRLDDIIMTYKNKPATPLFHISSPIYGWNGKFKDHCAHNDYIDIDDYPLKLETLMNEKGVDYRLDIEAKAKNFALKKLSEDLDKLKNI